MKKSKLLILMLSVCCAVALCFGTVTVMADEATGVTVSSLWTVSDSSVKTEIGENGGLKTEIVKGSSATLANDVDFRNFKAVLTFESSSFNKVVLRFKGKHAMDSSTVNDLVLSYDGTTVKAGLNTGNKVDLGNNKTLTVEYKAETGLFKINGTEIGTGKEIYMPYGTFGIYNQDQGVFNFTLTELNGETFQKTGTAVLDGKAPEIVMSDAFTHKQVPANYRATFYYCLADAVSSVNASLDVEVLQLPDGADEATYFKKGIVSDTYAVVIFYKVGDYKLTFKAKDTANNETTKELNVTVKEADTTAPTYDTAKVAEYQAKLTAMESEIIMSESFKFPLPPVSDGEYTPVGLMRYVMLYMAPSASTWSYSTVTTGRPSFTPSTVGTYRFKFVPVDLVEQRAAYDDCPEFTLTVRDTTAPKVTINFKDVQYIGIGVALSDVSITETSTYETIKVLEKYVGNGEVEVVEVVGDTFVPDAEASYRYTVTVVDEYLNKTEVVKDFRVIEPVKVNQVQNWISQNYLSIIFIGIAALCLVAIIVLEIVYKKSMKKKD
ncbi:MAG: hypothetical protein E7363_02830 [Clostridiales bacterium]|nr:hypothetical protein [Clostridiales bacterium]